MRMLMGTQQYPTEASELSTDNYDLRHRCICADEMGLGKTVSPLRRRQNLCRPPDLLSYSCNVSL